MTNHREDGEFGEGVTVQSASMVERVARALCDDTMLRWRSPLAMQADAWREFVPAARAAIEAMREPTDAMVMAGGHDQTYEEMIDEALK